MRLSAEKTSTIEKHLPAGYERPAAGCRSKQYELTKSALRKLRLSGHRLVLTPQTLIEFTAVAARPRDANGFGWSTARAVNTVAELKGNYELLPDKSDIFERWVALVTEHRITGKRVHDARLLAVMRSHGISHLLTCNTGDFPPIEGITVIAPADVV